MNTSFLELYSRYSRSHFGDAVELMCYCLLYFKVTTQPGYFPLYTWQIWILIISFGMSPWLFQPASFETHNLVAGFKDWVAWTMNEPSDVVSASSKGSWGKWHKANQVHTVDSKLFQLMRATLIRFITFMICCGALKCDNQHDSPSFRSLLLLQSSLSCFCMALLYLEMTSPTFVKKFLALEAGFVYTWVLRIIFTVSHLYINKLFLTPFIIIEEVETGHHKRKLFAMQEGISDSMHNTIILLTADVAVIHILVQVMHLYRHRLPKYFGGAADLFFREMDVWLGTLLFSIIFGVSLAPVTFTQGNMMFNRAFAESQRIAGLRLQLMNILHYSLKAQLIMAIKYLYRLFLRAIEWVQRR